MKNKTIIISCAGRGTRLGLNMPKALVEIEGKPMIIRTLEQLNECDDVRVIVGYKAQEVIDVVTSYRKNVKFVFNHDYMNNGTGASVSLGMKNSDKEFILTIDGDIIIHPEDFKKILNINDEFIGVCKKTTDNPVLTKTNDGKVISFSREEGEYEWTGVSLTKNGHMKPGDQHLYYMLIDMLPMNYELIRQKEVDTPNDLEEAKKWITNGYK